MIAFLNKIVDIIILPTIAFLCTLAITKILEYRHRNKKKVEFHYFFFRVRNLISINIMNNFTLNNKIKEKVFKDILSKQLSLFETSFLTLAKDIDSNPKKYEKDSVLIDSVAATLNEVQSQLYSFYLSDTSLSYEDIKTLQIVMNKYYKWNSDRIQRTMNLFESICNLSFYDTPGEKMCAILDSLMVVINEMLDNAQKTLDSLNGDLRGLSYKGEIIS